MPHYLFTCCNHNYAVHNQCQVTQVHYLSKGASDFLSLISHAHSFDAIKDCSGPTILMLMYDCIAKPKYGAFKQASFGHLDHPVLGNSSSIIVKQCWYTCPATRGHLTYNNHTQVTKLSSKINCLCWALALMGLVYDHINSYASYMDQCHLQFQACILSRVHLLLLKILTTHFYSRNLCKGNLTIKHNAQILARGIQSILDKYNTAEGCIPCKGDPKRKL